jgi:predicted O-methyltransferase YrrM
MREIPGWLTPEVGAAMRNLIWKTKPEVCVEIGVFAGKSLINTALALKENGHGVVYGIDPWRLDVALAGASPDEFDWNKVDLDAVHYDCMQAIYHHDVQDHVVVIRAKSCQAQLLFGWSEIDILYIDGGHSEVQSTDDAQIYLPCVKVGGHIWLDDTNYNSLKKAIGIVEQQCQLVKDFGHARLYKKL